jgi:acyl transferase domain-containing protein/NADPH:quinone reductase-like Zn-dependent oxidoreductase/NADP-dependent 3-hydroxy acid dehydrogenase YdfG/acyl carrier protein
MRESGREMVAIIGIGCRFPGHVDGPETFWNLMKNGDDGIVEIPADRWNVDLFYDADPATPGKMYVRNGGFLTQNINEFDALFFGISPREAAVMDPQQRLLLEVAWEAVEDAGLDPERLAGSDTGVYIGGFMLDNLLTQFSPLNREHIGTHSAVGSTLTILSNRLSYLFDFRGPSMTLDTACSSSLVALHEACEAILRGECSLALCGGVNIMHRPENFIAMCKGGFLSPDGRSKSFDIRADGYGRGEGAGIVVLKPYSAALRDGDDIYALVRGTGTNQDGRTNGITVPNPEAQEALIRTVCDKAKVDPKQIRYIEAHGTGTALGDPLEARAIGAVLGRARMTGQACVVGSVKANVGHLEAASGIAGVIKLALCLKHQAIPPLANLTQPNPNIPFADLGLRLPLTLEPMPSGEGPACVSINSFGYGGSNAHAILQEAIPATPLRTPDLAAATRPTTCILPLSARSQAALSGLAGAYLRLLSQPDAPSLRDLCYSAALRRGHYEQRVTLAADSREDLARQLQVFIEHRAGPGIAAGSVSVTGQRPVFVFTGMGPQWWAMGRELLQSEPVFRRTAEQCDAIFKCLSGWSVLDEMMADEERSRIRETQIAQPANFIVQVALAALWRAWGIEPGAIVGHSVGEVAAAYVAGVLSLEDAILVSYHRSRIQKKAAGLGTMLAVGLSSADVAPYLARFPDSVSLAAANAPTSITLAGDAACLQQIATELKEQDIFHRFLVVEVPYHSPMMNPLQPEILAALEGIQPRPAATPLYSTVIGDCAHDGAYDAAYWCRNVREPVYFERAMASLIQDDYRVFLEVGPHPVLATSVKDCLAQRGVHGVTLPSLRQGKPERATLLESLAGLYVAGATIDWNKHYPAAATYVKLPAYPWQRVEYWNEGDTAYLDRVARPAHDLLGRRIDGPTPAWESTLNVSLQPWLSDHRVDGLVILPGAAHVELGLALHREIDGRTSVRLENLEIQKALIVGANQQPHLVVSYDQASRHYAVFSREREGSPWTAHARGYLSFLPPGGPGTVSLDDIQARCLVPRSSAEHYEDMRGRGLQYGPCFQGVRQLWLSPDGTEVLARIEEHQALARCEQQNILHPCLLDGCFQALLAGLSAQDDRNTYVPVHIREVRLYESPRAGFWCHSRLVHRDGRVLEGDVTVVDSQGKLLADIRGVRAQALTNKAQDAPEDIEQCLYQFSWQPAPQGDATRGHGRWMLFCDRQGVGDRLAAQLANNGCDDIVVVRPGDAFRQSGPSEYVMRLDAAEDFRSLIAQAGAQPLSGIVSLWALDNVDAEDETGSATVVSALRLTQALVQSRTAQSLRVFFVTSRAQPVDVDSSGLAVAQAPLIGFARVAMNELDQLHIRMVDVDDGMSAVPRLAHEILSDSREEEVALRAERRYVNRLVRHSIHALENTGGPGAALSEDTVPGKGESYSSRAAARRRPGPHEVEVALESAWWYRPPGEAYSASPAGSEAIGVITSVGTGVQTVAVGARVVLPVQGKLRAFVTVPSDLVIHNPALESAVDTSQLIQFAAAYHALHDVSRLHKDERVLVHDAASPFGRAAIQVAQWLGATVYAAGACAGQHSDLISLGVARVFDPGSIDFVDRIHALTAPGGLDVVLSSSGGENVEKSVGLLGPSGRFINAGRFVHELAASLQANQLLAQVDLYQMMQHSPRAFGRLSDEVMERFEAGDFKPVDMPTIMFGELTKMLETGEGAATPGPYLVRFHRDETAHRVAGEPDAERIHSNATYLITGGFGGFGLETAMWLVRQGARHLALIGRSGASTSEAQKAVCKLQEAGAEVLALAADVAEESEVQRVLALIANTMPPLKGLFHAAAVLDDGAIHLLDPDKIAAVMRPKALGAWLLHRYTRDLKLDYFVLFSSIGSLVGNPGQAPYVAANAFLDALAHHRRAQDLPAICINWGALSQVGMAARHQGVEDYLNRMGFGSLTPTQALNLLDRILDWRPTAIGAALMHWEVFRRSYPAWASAPRNSIVMAPAIDSGAAGGHGPLQLLSDLAPDARRDVITQGFTELIATVLQIPPHQVNRGLSLLNMGMDSLMAIEIQTGLEQRTGLTVPTLELMKDNSADELIQQFVVRTSVSAVHVRQQHMDAAHVDAASTLPPRPLAANELLSTAPENLDAALNELSDHEVEQALQALASKE